MSRQKFSVFAYGPMGRELSAWIISQKEHPAFCLLKKADVEQDAIRRLFEDVGVPSYFREDFSDQILLEKISTLKSGPIFLLWWPDIIKIDLINNKAASKFVNLHPSYLPYCRGKYPYYWAIVEGAPFGASLHFIDEKIDAGTLIARDKIELNSSDNGDSVYNKGLDACRNVFKKNFSSILNDEIKPIKINQSSGSYHHSSELEAHSEIDLEATYSGRDLINRLRARSFRAGGGAFFVENGVRHEIYIKISESQEN